MIDSPTVMDNWQTKMIPYAKSDLERKVLSKGPSSFAGSQCLAFLKSRYMQMVGIVEHYDGTYHTDWKREYIQLKGWENMSDGEKFLCTHRISSSAMGMGMAHMQDELERMKQSNR